MRSALLALVTVSILGLLLARSHIHPLGDIIKIVRQTMAAEAKRVEETDRELEEILSWQTTISP